MRLAARDRTDRLSNMWRSHFVVFEEMPSKGGLEKLGDGYQLFRETRTRLLYLTAHSEPLRRRPDFAGFLEREIRYKADVSALQHLLGAESGDLATRTKDIDFGLIHRAASLSRQLEVPVLVAEITDDEYAMAVMADNGALTYLRFRTMLTDEAGELALVEVRYRPESGLKIDRKPSQDIYGLAQTAIGDVFQIRGLDLYHYCQDKSPKANAKRSADSVHLPIKENRDSYGAFKRLNHAAPQITFATRLLITFRYAGSFLVLPFILVGMVLLAIIYSDKPNAEPDTSLGKFFCLGFAALVIPVLAGVLVLRAILG